MVEPLAELDVSIVIPSYNRGVAVGQNVERCLALRPRAREIILVDDHSAPDSEAVLRRLAKAHSSVHYHRLPANAGQATSRSVGFEMATGRYVVSLDDDSWFMDNDALRRVWDRMEAHSECGLLAFNLQSPGLPEPVAEDRLWAVADHLTCGAAYRGDVLRRTGYHVRFLRYVGEETDLSLKVRQAGFEVFLDMNVRVFHDYDPATRSRATLERVSVFGTRNDFARTLIYFPWRYVPILLAWKAVSHLKAAVIKGYLLPTLRGFWGFPSVAAQSLRERTPVSPAVARRYLALRRRPELVSQ